MRKKTREPCKASTRYDGLQENQHVCFFVEKAKANLFAVFATTNMTEDFSPKAVV